MPLGDKTKKVSTREQLLKDRNVSGVGAPTHEPEVDRQTYINTTDSAVSEWYKGTWTHS